MPAERRCEKCGAALAPIGAEALCPNCMLREALREGADHTVPPAAASPGQTGVSVVAPLTEKPGDRIGRYKLLQQIGEGGMGVVYMAEQEEPVRRRVALKVIKLGMDTKSVIARFEAERQALALMDHPNIAKVLDAGATDTGRPYFVMELVRGIRITDYYDQNQLSTPQRLDLFTQVCQAIQHAHQKGVIHRDIKPSNILVTLHDSVPVPKIIDFGIAKATSDQRLTDKTLFTAFEQFVGTPAYMSPEQAELSGLDIDTRSDIYSLGVLLYELLTGQTPFNQKELLAAGLDAMRRTIREKEPPKPSTRLTMELVAADVSRRKSISVGQSEISADSRRRLQELIKLVRGDLDWIVMKALEKDRARRYESANGLAMDIQRHLDNEPVVARPPSAAYRFQKLVRRNKIAVAATSAVAAALIIGLSVSTWMFFKDRADLRRAVAAEQKATTEGSKSKQVAQFLQAMLQGVGPSVAKGRDTALLREILDKAVERVGKELTNQPAVEAELLSTIGNVYVELDLFPSAEELFQKALAIRLKQFGEEHDDVAASLTDLSNLFTHQGKYAEAEAMDRRALGIAQKLYAGDDQHIATLLNTLAITLHYREQLSESEAMQRQALAMQRRLFGAEHEDIANSLNSLAGVLRDENQLDEAVVMHREAFAMWRKLLRSDHPNVIDSLNNLGLVLDSQGKLQEAEECNREALALARKVYGPEHSVVGITLTHLADVLRERGQLAESESLFRDSLLILRPQYGDQSLLVATTLNNLVLVLIRRGNLAEAEAMQRECTDIREKKIPDDWRTFSSRSALGGILLEEKQFAAAEPLMLSGYEGLKQRVDKLNASGRNNLREALKRLLQLYEETGRPGQATEWRQKLEAFFWRAVTEPAETIAAGCP